MSHHRVAAGYLRTGNIDLVRARNRRPARGLGEGHARCRARPRFAIRSATPARCSRWRRSSVGTTLVLNLGRAGRRARIARQDPQDALRPAARERRHGAGRLRARCQRRRWMRCSRHDREPDWDSVAAGAESYRRDAAALRRHGAARHPRSRRIPPPDRRRAREPRAGSQGGRNARRATCCTAC